MGCTRRNSGQRDYSHASLDRSDGPTLTIVGLREWPSTRNWARMPRPWTDRLANDDFAGSLADRNQLDVHNPDPTARHLRTPPSVRAANTAHPHERNVVETSGNVTDSGQGKADVVEVGSTVHRE